MVFCTHCGSKNPDAAKFCGSCGKNVVVAANPPPQVPQAPDPRNAPPGTFMVQLPPNIKPGQAMQVPVPQGLPQAGQMAQFRIPQNAKPLSFVYVPLPPANQQGARANQGAAYGPPGYGQPGYGGGYGQPPYGQPPYGSGPYNNNGNSGMGTAAAAGVGLVGGMLLADAMFDDGGGFF